MFGFLRELFNISQSFHSFGQWSRNINDQGGHWRPSMNMMQRWWNKYSSPPTPYTSTCKHFTWPKLHISLMWWYLSKLHWLDEDHDMRLNVLWTVELRFLNSKAQEWTSVILPLSNTLYTVNMVITCHFYGALEEKLDTTPMPVC